MYLEKLKALERDGHADTWLKPHSRKIVIYDNYSPKWRWLVVGIIHWLAKDTAVLIGRCNRPFHGFPTFEMNQLRKILWHHWKERLNISNIAKFESDTS